MGGQETCQGTDHATCRATRRAIFRADAAARIGGGHVMRCLTLARHLAAAGWDVGFACIDETLTITPQVEAFDLLSAATSEEIDAAALAARWPPGCDVLVVDHYGLDAAFETPCRGWADTIVVIDDLSNRRHDCDLLIDSTLGREEGDYAGLTPKEALVLAGSPYALLRPAFGDRRDAALARRVAVPDVARILVSVGLTDVGAITARIVGPLLRLPDAISFDVVVGAHAPSRSALATLAAETKRVRLHVDPPDMADLMSEADLAIGAGGTTSWERCCLGLPTVLLVLADNQRQVAERLSAAGAVICAEPTDEAGEGSVVEAVERFVADPALVRTMSDAAAAIVDGRGTERVALAVRGLAATFATRGGLNIRRAILDDSRHVWAWRNDPVSRAQSHDRAPIDWSVHDAWFARAINDPARIILIGVVDGMPIGIVRFDRSDGSAFLVSLALAPSMRGRGLGTKLLASACSLLSDLEPEAAMTAEVRTGNVASRRLFERCGFEHVAGAGDFATYRRGVEAVGRPTAVGERAASSL